MGRFFVAGRRTDSLMLGPLRAAQVVSIGAIVFAAFFIYLKMRKETKSDQGN
jgi:phosphatidylglycerol:prolipoprotein diacylglycerol transferase